MYLEMSLIIAPLTYLATNVLITTPLHDAPFTIYMYKSAIIMCLHVLGTQSTTHCVYTEAPTCAAPGECVGNN